MTSSQEAIGLTQAEVDAAHQAGQTNYVPRTTSRSISEIFRANVFTVFNAILTAAVIAVLVAGDPRDAVFGLVMVINAVIGILSELRSKHTLDSVAVLESPQSTVWRDGKEQTIDSTDLVIGDAVSLALGDQVPADGKIVRSAGLEIDESILTGESRPVHKSVDDKAMSGSAVVAGSGVMITEKVGKDSWAQQITAEAKKFSLATSEIQQAINSVLKVITIALPFVVGLLMWSQLRAEGGSPRVAIVLAVAGVVGMIPQGLVLLTSMNFGLAAATLARRGVLVQELPAVEILARVDELCLDKTGTITTGGIRGKEVVWDDKNGDSEGVGVLAYLTRDRANATAIAVQDLLGKLHVQPFEGGTEIPFSSSRKWSAIQTSAGKTWILGAPEILLSDNAAPWASDIVAQSSRAGNRTLCLSISDSPISQDMELPQERTPRAIIVLEEDIRSDAHATLDYFKDQGVHVRIISGDAPATVGTIAKNVGLRGPDGADPVIVDARTLPPIETPEFDAAIEQVQVFGRVTPEQKKGLVLSMQRAGHTVAMTGDGVNDALALKTADLGIAMGNGAPATKAVSRLVLMNSQFSVLPGVVAEGRRIIANMERVSALFLSKTTYAMLLAVVVSIFAWTYPFLPRHLTYIGWFTIGTPAFFLALAPNSQRYRPGFLRRTLSVAIPSGIIMGLAALGAYLVVGPSDKAGQSAATLTMIIAALWLLTLTARPLVPWRIALIVIMVLGAIVGVLIEPIRSFFALEWPNSQQWITIVCFALVACALIEVSFRLTQRWRDNNVA